MGRSTSDAPIHAIHIKTAVVLRRSFPTSQRDSFLHRVPALHFLQSGIYLPGVNPSEDKIMFFRMPKHLASILFIGATALLSACSSSQPTTPAAEAPKPITAEERVQWYQTCWSQFNDAKWDSFRTCYADDATAQQQGYGMPSASGADAIVEGSKDFKKLSPDGHGEGQFILVNGNRIASVFLLTGTNSGPMTGPDGKVTKPTTRNSE
jgi:hypothetical protein